MDSVSTSRATATHDYAATSRATATHDYAAQHSDELTLRRGDALLRLRPIPTEPGWAEAHTEAGRSGMVPLSHVQLHPHADESQPLQVAIEPSGASTQLAVDSGGAGSSFAMALERRCGGQDFGWACVHQALRDHHGLPQTQPPGPAALATELQRLIDAHPEPLAFHSPLLLPPQSVEAPPCEAARGRCSYLAPLGPSVPPFSYPPPHEEQFNAQRFGVMELLWLAQQTGRVLVEPMLHLMPRNDSRVEARDYGAGAILGHRLEPLSSFFNVSRLTLGVPLVTLPRFARAVGGRVDRLWRLAPPLGCAHSRRTHLLSRAVGEDTVDAYGLPLRVDDESCDDAPRARDAPVASYFAAAERSIGLWRYRRGWLHGAQHTVRWPEPMQPDYWEMRRRLVFRDELWQAARAFAAAESVPSGGLGGGGLGGGGLGGEPFVAIHWRRGDRTHPEMGAGGTAQYDAVAPAALVGFARRVLRLTRLRRVLLLTNSGRDNEITQLHAALPALVRYAPSRPPASVGHGAGGAPLAPSSSSSSSPPPPHWRTLQHDACVEQILATLAAAFVAGPHHFDKVSSFARVVIEERALHGQPPNSTFFMQPGGALLMHVRDGSPLTAEMRPSVGSGGGEVPGPPALHCIGCVD